MERVVNILLLVRFCILPTAATKPSIGQNGQCSKFYIQTYLNLEILSDLKLGKATFYACMLQVGFIHHPSYPYQIPEMLSDLNLTAGAGGG